jgi:hypothetical protein
MATAIPCFFYGSIFLLILSFDQLSNEHLIIEKSRKRSSPPQRL